MTDVLAGIFVQQIPAMLKQARASKGLLGFVVTSGPEKGFWVISLEALECRRGRSTDTPSVVIEAPGAVLAALFTGALATQQALATGALNVVGDPALLASFAESLGAGSFRVVKR
jgi:hypothetical protein